MKVPYPLQVSRALIVAVVSAGLIPVAGCSDPKADREAFTESRVEAEVRKAKTSQDPWAVHTAMIDIGSRLRNTCETNGWTGRTMCGEFTEREAIAKQREIHEKAESFLLQAVKQGHPAAVRFVYEQEQLKQPFVDLLPTVLEAADEARGTTQDRSLLLIAGRIYGQGRYITRDTSRAVGYLARAWAAGESTAAAEAAMLFKQINDVRNAYLWALRCVGKCDRGPYLSLTELEEQLSPEAAKQAQSAASTHDVVELDTRT